jgi:hypothetical protein
MHATREDDDVEFKKYLTPQEAIHMRRLAMQRQRALRGGKASADEAGQVPLLLETPTGEPASALKFDDTVWADTGASFAKPDASEF